VTRADTVIGDSEITDIAHSITNSVIQAGWHRNY
jgi:hypothetical protein